MRYLKGTVTLDLDTEKCVGCGMCLNVCPHDVFSFDQISHITKRDNCMECGACAKNCPVDAISVRTGVGCALAIIRGWFTGTEPNCDCSNNDRC